MKKRIKPHISEAPTESQQMIAIAVFLQYGSKNVAYDANGVDVYVVDNKKYIKVEQVEVDCSI